MLATLESTCHINIRRSNDICFELLTMRSLLESAAFTVEETFQVDVIAELKDVSVYCLVYSVPVLG